jgi:hypothetical protein
VGIYRTQFFLGVFFFFTALLVTKPIQKNHLEMDNKKLQSATLIEDLPIHPLIGQTFPTIEKAKEALDEVTFQGGYSLALEVRRKTRIAYICGKGRKPRSQYRSGAVSKRRESSTQKTDCPFKIGISLGEDGWKVYHIAGNPASHTHNHGPVEGQSLPFFRRRVVESLKDDILKRWKEGQSQSHILRTIRKGPPARPYIQRHDISNFIKAHQSDQTKETDGEQATE